MNTKLLEQEFLLKEGFANYYATFAGPLGYSAGGMLYLTTQRLIFEGHAVNIRREFLALDIKSIINCTTGFPNSLIVLTKDNCEHRFAVNNKQDWMDKIRHGM